MILIRQIDRLTPVKLIRYGKDRLNCRSLEYFTSEIDRGIRKIMPGTLLGSASQLTGLRRYREAYRLCLETLQEVPGNPDALKMISSFAEKIRKRRTGSRVVMLSIISATALYITDNNIVFKSIAESV